MGENQLILGGQSVELVGGGDKVPAGQSADLFRHQGIKPLRGVQAGAHGGAAQRQLPQRLHSQFNQLPVPLQTGAPAGDLLGKGNGGGVLQMGAAGFDDAPVFRLQPGKGGGEQVNGGNHPVRKAQHRRNVHGCGEGVVGGLGHIHIVIGMQQLFAQNGVAPAGNDLVGVHIGLGAGAGLPDHQREMIGQLPVNHLIRGLADGIPLLFGHLLRAELGVCLGRGLFQDAEGVNDLPGHGLLADADGKILMRALGLGAPIFVGRHLHLPHRVVLNSVFHR